MSRNDGQSETSLSSVSNVLTLSETNDNSDMINDKIISDQAMYSEIRTQNLTQENPVSGENNENSVQIVENSSGKRSRKNNDKDKSVKQKHSNQSSAQGNPRQ